MNIIDSTLLNASTTACVKLLTEHGFTATRGFGYSVIVKRDLDDKVTDSVVSFDTGWWALNGGRDDGYALEKTLSKFGRDLS